MGPYQLTSKYFGGEGWVKPTASVTWPNSHFWGKLRLSGARGFHLYNIKTAANPQIRLPKKTFSSTLIVFSSFVFLSRKPLVVVHFCVIKPPYDIPEKLPNIVTHFMIFSKS